MTTKEKNIKNTSEQILDLAQELCQKNGFNAFSFRDIAEKLGIKSASIHYHFPTKDDLGVALMRRYRNSFKVRLTEIFETTDDPKQQIDAFCSILGNLLSDNGKMCLCGILASEIETLSKELQTEVKLFFQDTEDWVSNCIDIGKKKKVFLIKTDSRVLAQSIISLHQGLLLSARAFNDSKRFKSGSNWIQTILEG